MNESAERIENLFQNQKSSVRTVRFVSTSEEVGWFSVSKPFLRTNYVLRDLIWICFCISLTLL